MNKISEFYIVGTQYFQNKKTDISTKFWEVSEIKSCHYLKCKIFCFSLRKLHSKTHKLIFAFWLNTSATNKIQYLLSIPAAAVIEHFTLYYS